MAVYQAPDIKDRIAVGDDLYQIADSGGKKKLTPDPTEVTEAGTPINKALLQPMADAIQRMDAALVPYTLYYWRRRPTANSYVETRQTAYSAGVGYSHSSNSKTYYYLDAIRYVRYTDDESGTDYFATLKYASSITINQSTGAISLNNPSTYTFTSSDNVRESSVYGRFQGKYVQGFLGITSKVFYIPTSAYMTGHNWENSGGDVWNEEGYEVTSDMGSTLMPMLINTTKITTTGAWETISSDTSDAYPHSGTQDGYEWVYCGEISDFAPGLHPLGVKSFSLTSASWSNGTYSLQLPCTRYFLWSNDIFLLVDSGLAYGAYQYSGSSSYDYRTYYAAGNEVVTSYTKYTFSASGVTMTGSGSKTLFYLPLPS
mgnify:CR=1 FL=1